MPDAAHSAGPGSAGCDCVARSDDEGFWVKAAFAAVRLRYGVPT
jgi:hypothetical protein